MAMDDLRTSKEMKNNFMYTEYNGKLEDEMKNIPSGCATMVFADLPYGTTNCKWDSLVDLYIYIYFGRSVGEC